MHGFKIDICIISETWLNSRVSFDLVCTERYCLLIEKTWETSVLVEELLLSVGTIGRLNALNLITTLNVFGARCLPPILNI